MKKGQSMCIVMLLLVTGMLVAAALATAGLGEQGQTASARKSPLQDPSFFPLAVWCQDPAKAQAYREIGINTYVALWEGPTEQHLEALRAAGMWVICDQNDVGLKHRDDPTIIGWMHGDEPDNAQGLPEGGYGPAIPPERIIAGYQEMRRNDPTRPVMLNLGQGVARDDWVGIGCVLADYPEYVKAADILSFDIYPVASLPHGEDWLWLVARGLDRLREWSGGERQIWNALECTRISNTETKATPHQVRAEVWMSLIHGSRGIIYFVHQFKPTFIEAGLLADPEMTAAVGAINQQVLSLAPILNTPSVQNAVGVTSSEANVPVDIMVKRQGSDLYIFAVCMRNQATHARFRVDDLRKGWVKRDATAQVVGENRTIPVWGGGFEDDFGPYDVHIYQVPVG